MQQLPNGAFLSGTGVFAVCPACEKVVRLNKFLLGSFHLCLTEQELAQKMAMGHQTSRFQSQAEANAATAQYGGIDFSALPRR